MRLLLTILIASLMCEGCANLSARKVPLRERLAGQDHKIKGFRYYLGRPYVLVKKKILVTQSNSLVMATNLPKAVAASPNDVEEAITYLDGPLRGQTRRIADVEKTNPGSGAVHRLSDGDVDALRSMLERQAEIRLASYPTPAEYVDGRQTQQAMMDAVEVADSASPTVPSEVGQHLQTDNLGKPDEKATPTAPLQGDIEICFFPDMDEQYAVHNRNWLAKSAYALYFKDGWQLTDASAELDSTTVAIEVLNLIDTAVDAAKDIAVAGIDRKARAKPDAKDTEYSATTDSQIFQLVESTYIKPGVYRINKPWEMDGPPIDEGCGLLARLGLEMVTEVQLLPAKRESIPTSAVASSTADQPVPGTRRLAPPNPMPAAGENATE